MEQKKCPYCAAQMYATETACPACGKSLPRPKAESPPKPPDLSQEQLDEIADEIKSHEYVPPKHRSGCDLFAFLVPIWGFIFSAIMLASDDPNKWEHGRQCFWLACFGVVLWAFLAGIVIGWLGSGPSY